MYKNDAYYSRFKDGERYDSDTYSLMIADDNSYIYYVMDYGSDNYLAGIRIKTFNENIKAFTDFLVWASQPSAKRDGTVQALAGSHRFWKHDFSIAEDSKTHEPLLIITRDPGIYLPVKIYAMDKKRWQREFFTPLISKPGMKKALKKLLMTIQDFKQASIAPAERKYYQRFVELMVVFRSCCSVRPGLNYASVSYGWPVFFWYCAIKYFCYFGKRANGHHVRFPRWFPFRCWGRLHQ